MHQSCCCVQIIALHICVHNPHVQCAPPGTHFLPKTWPVPQFCVQHCALLALVVLVGNLPCAKSAVLSSGWLALWASPGNLSAKMLMGCSPRININQPGPTRSFMLIMLTGMSLPLISNILVFKTVARTHTLEL